jgi:hypothetical protein
MCGFGNMQNVGIILVEVSMTVMAEQNHGRGFDVGRR